MKKILFITTTNLAANPRLTKELQLAIDNGFKATVIQFRVGNWSDEKTMSLQTGFKEVKFIQLSALRHPLLPWVFGSLLEKLLQWLPGWLLKGYWLSVAVNKRTVLLSAAIKKNSEHFDWVIAHNPGSFYPAMKAAQKMGAGLGIDVEDYHPGESNQPGTIRRMIRLMKNILPKASYCSFASPLIREKVEKEITSDISKKIVLLNGFPENEFKLPVTINQERLQCVWFSQFIDNNRGLETVIPVIDSLYPAVELHLIGYLNKEFAEQFLENKCGIVCHGSMTQQELHFFLTQCDIGLAVEPGRDINNQLAISNKLMAYVQAGLFIIASHTPAQDLFLTNSQLDYLQTDLSPEDLKKQLEQLIQNKTSIRESRPVRFEKGKNYSWENIVIPLLDVWNN